MSREPYIRSTFFSRTILTFLTPLFLSIIISGFFSIRLTVGYIRENVHRFESTVLRQTRDEIDSILEELNIVALNFTINTNVQQSLSRILKKDVLLYDDLRELEFIHNQLSISHYSRMYIHSIYVYFNNPQHNFITSEAIITRADSYPDKGWLESYMKHPQSSGDWTELRSIRKRAFSTDETPVLTFYKRVYSSISKKFTGVIVINVLRDYLHDSLEARKTFKDQTIFILDREQKIVSSNSDSYAFLIPAILKNPRDLFELREDGRLYTVAKTKSRYDFTYISVVPNSTLYALTDYLWKQNLFYILLSLLIGISLSVYMARNSTRQIRTIIEIIRSAKEGKLVKTRDLNGKIRNSYQYILYNVINTFIEKDYLKIQLSERMFKSRVDELIALQSQINPHFLFNTLETINMKAIGLTRSDNDVSEMIGHLSLILRYAMGDPEDLVPIEREIEHAQSYLAIQTVRYRDKIRVEWEYDPSVLDFRTIKLLFQPLIENSIYHGIRERDGAGDIRITVAETEDSILLTVSDNGIGIPENRLAEIRKKLAWNDEQFEHIGLYNTNRRIRLSFGDTYGISVESAEGEGTTVTVRLPKK